MHNLIKNGKIIAKVDFSKLTINQGIELVQLGYSFEEIV